MASANAELVLESIRRFQPGGLDEWAELWHRDSRLDPPSGWPEPGPFVGLAAVREQFERAFDAWSQLRFEDVEIVAESGDWVVASFRLPTQGATSGLEADFRLAVAYRVQDGLLAACVVRWTIPDALEAAGLSA